MSTLRCGFRTGSSRRIQPFDWSRSTQTSGASKVAAGGVGVKDNVRALDVGRRFLQQCHAAGSRSGVEVSRVPYLLGLRTIRPYHLGS